jgi:hypothetical protein
MRQGRESYEGEIEDLYDEILDLQGCLDGDTELPCTEIYPNNDTCRDDCPVCEGRSCITAREAIQSLMADFYYLRGD